MTTYEVCLVVPVVQLVLAVRVLPAILEVQRDQAAPLLHHPHRCQLARERLQIHVCLGLDQIRSPGGPFGPGGPAGPA